MNQTENIHLSENPTPSQTHSQGEGCLNILVFLFTLGWIIATTLLRHISSFTATVTPGKTTSIIAGIGVLVQIAMFAVLLLPLAVFWSSLRYRQIYRTWTLAAGLTLLLAPVYLVDRDAAQTQYTLQIVLVLLYCIFLIWLSRRRSRSVESAIEPNTTAGTPAASSLHLTNAFLFGMMIALPWLAWGALGSPLDVLLALGLGSAIGLACALLIELFLLPGLLQDNGPTGGTYFLGGLSIGAILLLGAGALAFAYGGLQLFLIQMLPGLGWLIIALKLTRNSPRDKILARQVLPLTVLIGLSAAAPIALVDGDELLLVVTATAGELLSWAQWATLASTLIILVLGLAATLYLLFRRNNRSGQTVIQPDTTSISGQAADRPVEGRKWGGLLTGLAVVGILALAALVYFVIGQPGFYGERMFVIFKEQADTSSVATMPDPNQRRQVVYTLLVEHADTTQAGIRATLDRLGLLYTPYYLVNAIETPGNPLLRLWLLSRPEVDRVLDSPRLRPLPETPPTSTGYADAPASPEWNLTMIGADKVWEELGVTGQGILIGQSDSGVQGDHPELSAAYRGQANSNDFNWFDPWNGTRTPTDIGGHGTHTLGSILGRNTGVAPGAQWIGCVNLARNLGNPALYLDCWQFMLAPFQLDGEPFTDGEPSRGAHVLNNSWGCPAEEGCDINTFQAAAHALRDAGVFVVVSAGNDGPACETLNTPPPTYEEVFSVGAIDRYSNLAMFSSIGPVTADGSGRVKPDLLAPGVRVLSAVPNSRFDLYSGTSMAGPHVVGVVALMWSANPALIGDIETTTAILRQTARPYEGDLPDCPGADQFPSTATGYGIVDAYAAVQAALAAK